MLPDSDQIAQDAAKIRAHLAMLAARDVANVLVKHALTLADHGASEAAQLFDFDARFWREHERQWTAAAGLAE